MRFLSTIMSSAAIGFLTLSPALSHSAEIGNVAGQKIDIVKLDNSQNLVVNGKTLLSDTYITLDNLEVIGDQIALAGTNSPGGNACTGTNFILLISPDATTRLDGPLEGCHPMEMKRDGDVINYQQSLFPGFEAESWKWTVGDGFVQQASIPFVPDAGTTWNDIEEDSAIHLSTFLNNEAVYQAAAEMLGERAQHVLSLMTGPASGTWNADGAYVGSVCRTHQCSAENGFLYLSPKNKQLYLAVKVKDEPVETFPASREAWSKNANSELTEWLNQLP